MNSKIIFCWSAFGLSLSSWAQFPAAAQTSPVTNAASVVVALDGNSRTWQNQSGQQVVEIQTGMNFFDPGSQQWLRSDPSFVAAPDGSSFVAAKLASKVTLKASLDTASALTAVTPDGITLQSTPIAIGLYDAASGKSVVIASLTNSQGVLVDAQHVLYPAALAGSLLEADVVYSLPDCGSFRQDVVISKFNGPLDPTVWGLPASSTNTLRLQIFSEYYGDVPSPSEIMHPIQVETDPALRASMASPDLVDYTLAFGDVYTMSLGWAYVGTTNDPATGTGTPLGAVQVAKEFITAGQPSRTFLIESVPLSWLQSGLSTLPPVTAQLSPAPGSTIPRTAMNNKAARSRLVAAKQDRAEWCAALPCPAPRQRQSGKATLAVAQAAMANRARTAGRVVIDYVVTLSGSTNSETYISTNTYFVSGPVYVDYATIQGGAVFKYPNNETAFLDVEETLTLANVSSSAIFTAGDDDNHGTTLSTSYWSGWTGNVSGYYANPALEVNNWSSVAITNFSFYYASNALSLIGANTSVTANLSGSFFSNCLLGIAPCAASSGSVTLTATSCTNVNVAYPFTNNAAGVTATLTNCVVSNVTQMVTNPCGIGSFTLTFTNCTVQNVTNSGASSCVTIINAGNTGFSVNGYGAVGNDIHNDATAISDALQAAVNWCSNVGPATLYFQAGSNYFLNTTNALGNFLTVPPVTNLTLASDSATTSATLSSTATAGLTMLAVNGPASDIVVSNLVFTSSHSVTTNVSTGVYFGQNVTTSMESDTLSNITVVDCVFTGFADDMCFRGSSNCTIYSNSFLFPLGRDSGSWTNQYPNVGILVQYVDGTTFWPGYFSVYSNTFNGLSGTTALSNLVSKGMGDGFLATTVDGLNCYRNNITNTGAEGIYAGVIPNSAPVNPCYIYNNIISKDISLASGTGIRWDLPGSQVYSNFVLNSSFGLALGTPTNDYSATNMSFYSNNVTVASSVLPYFGWAFGINVWPYTGCTCYSNKFYSNTITLNWANVVVSPLGSYPFPYNVGIASSGGGSNYFTNNTFTVSASNPTNSYYGIAVNGMYLDPNFGNIVNNTFTPNGGSGVFAEGYPINTTDPYPNNTNDYTIQTNIFGLNSF